MCRGATETMVFLFSRNASLYLYRALKTVGTLDSFHFTIFFFILQYNHWRLQTVNLWIKFFGSNLFRKYISFDFVFISY